MIIRKPKKKRIMGKWIIAFWLLSAAGVLLLMPAEASVAKYQQNQQIAAIDRTGTAAETDSSLDVAKIELGDPVGILTIPSISLKLPIYDGTSDKILENGVGITEGTGDITGGNGKNPLIAGHSGLYKDNLFDDLPSVKKGEKFYIKVDGEQHAYQIDRIEEVQKDELQREFVTYLEPNPNEDRVTLMTCTPKGINTHRFLVYGKRVTFTKSELKDEENKKQKLSWKWLLGSTVFLSVMIIGSLFVYKKKK
ncbi:class C sortase [Enterococcus hirae]|uniref:class C sortase n=1 Tax=Enterococcus TaxID=1350 RepID=UPI000282654A|nr:class C sortase [Enterococcus faecium]EJX83762.1 sortase family protein [Enterococcus faecium ERV99]EOI38367.1 sortase [Enterococcus faecium EnGen0313]MCV3197948.1 class C sortase [Enterococcus faecium]HAR8798678.1 class C sortase [Enterococcus faecium]HAZ1189019.1 class C sortase [Enterococcus faecium]